jgi:hypothetical protein
MAWRRTKPNGPVILCFLSVVEPVLGEAGYYSLLTLQSKPVLLFAECTFFT